MKPRDILMKPNAQSKFSEENQAYKTENTDFRRKMANLNPKIRFYPVFRSIQNTDSSKFIICPTPKEHFLWLLKE